MNRFLNQMYHIMDKHPDISQELCQKAILLAGFHSKAAVYYADSKNLLMVWEQTDVYEEPLGIWLGDNPDCCELGTVQLPDPMLGYGTREFEPYDSIRYVGVNGTFRYASKNDSSSNTEGDMIFHLVVPMGYDIATLKLLMMEVDTLEKADTLYVTLDMLLTAHKKRWDTLCGRDGAPSTIESMLQNKDPGFWTYTLGTPFSALYKHRAAEFTRLF